MKENEKICPFMSKPVQLNNIDFKVPCAKDKCMAWGKWRVDGAYKEEYEEEGCVLLR